MSKLKKFAGILLALVMCFGLTCTAFATGETITVTNANVGETYEAYLVFTVTTNGTNNTYYITSTSPYFEYIDPSQASDSPFTLVETGTSGTYQVTFTNGEAAAAYIVSIGAKGSAVDKVVAESETAVLTVDKAGYYFVTTTTGSAVSTDATTGNVNITDKNSKPTVDKEETTDGTAGIGDTVEYTATITAAKTATVLVYHDVMSEGLTFDNTSVTVTIDGTTVTNGETTYYTVSEDCDDDCTFEVTFTDDALALITSDTTEVKITYSATVNEKAVIDGTGNTNTGSVSYGNEGTSEESSTTTKVYDFDLTKQDSEGNSLTATFTLADSNGDLISFVSVANGYRKATASETGTTTIEAGTVNISGLAAGTYTLTETKAPD
ncbi:MAG: hypothetical protein LUD82_08955, partial [Clostridiales bacterium]|nr:hypothetical protein [Clostridiales bacterium]